MKNDQSHYVLPEISTDNRATYTLAESMFRDKGASLNETIDTLLHECQVLHSHEIAAEQKKRDERRHAFEQELERLLGQQLIRNLTITYGYDYEGGMIYATVAAGEDHIAIWQTTPDDTLRIANSIYAPSSTQEWFNTGKDSVHLFRGAVIARLARERRNRKEAAEAVAAAAQSQPANTKTLLDRLNETVKPHPFTSIHDVLYNTAGVLVEVTTPNHSVIGWLHEWREPSLMLIEDLTGRRMLLMAGPETAIQPIAKGDLTDLMAYQITSFTWHINRGSVNMRASVFEEILNSLKERPGE